MSEGEDFIRSEAALRGIDGDTAAAVAQSEGGVEFPGLVGTFDTGSSFWQYQLHYGGEAYPQYGVPGQSVAGMGNDFTALTAWAPGDPNAARDACRYALNRAKEGGWGPWYGAASIGITGFDGIDQSVPWDPNSQTWDYETGGGSDVADPIVLPAYDARQPAFAQNDSWSCAPTSTRWALHAYQREPTEQWIEGTMLAEGVVTTQWGLMDASGRGLADFLVRHYGEYGYTASAADVTFEEVAAEAAAGRHPLCLGGRAWCHWTGCRGFDGVRLLLANPAPGYMGITQSMTREQFAALGPFSMVRLVHPEAEAVVPPSPGPGPDPSDPYAPWRGAVGSGLLSAMAEDRTLPAQRVSTWLPLGVTPADVEQCLGQNMVNYVWSLTTNTLARYRSV